MDLLEALLGNEESLPTGFNKNISICIQVPMTMDAYAAQAGITLETARQQSNRGFLPTFKQGKRRMVNTYALAIKCLSDPEFKLQLIEQCQREELKGL